MTYIPKITDHVDRAQARLPEQHQGKIKLAKFLAVFSAEIQAAEDGIYPLVTDRSIDTAIGAQLDVLGRIVSEERAGLDDDSYRLRVRARVATNKSHGSMNELLNIIRLIISPSVVRIDAVMQFPAAVLFTIFDLAVSDILSDTLIGFLRDAAGAGVRVQLITSDDVDDEMFYTAVATALDGPQGPVQSEITVFDTTNFPASGQLILDEGRSAEETVTYTSKTVTAFTLSSTLSNEHEDRAGVVLVGSPGKGLGDATDTGVGGKLSSVKE